MEDCRGSRSPAGRSSRRRRGSAPSTFLEAAFGVEAQDLRYGWHKYDGGEWSPVAREPGQQPARPETREARMPEARTPGEGTRDLAGAGDRARDGGGTIDQLDRDFKSRYAGASRSRDAGAWRSGSSTQGHRGSWGGSRGGFGGGRGGRMRRR